MAEDSPIVEVVPVPIGIYRYHETLGDAVLIEADKVSGLFADFYGSVVDWVVPMEDRDGDAVKARLQQWANPDRPANTILYWVGHGWYNGNRAALAHADSPAAVHTWGVSPAEIAEPIRARQAMATDKWAMVIIDTCRSCQFVDQVNADFASDPGGTERILLIGVSGDGATSLGRFSATLEASLRDTFGSLHTVAVQELGYDLERRLGDCMVIPRRLGGVELVRREDPVAAAMPGPLDLIHELEHALVPLSPTERRHFLAKARGAEEGELTWFFQGRATEIGEVVQWLRASQPSMLVVTGPAGSGKSALLGDTVLHSMPEVRDVLIRGGLVQGRDSDQLPPDDCFDAVIQLTGLTLDEVISRIATAGGLGETPSGRQNTVEISTDRDLEWLMDVLASRSEPFTILFDALDEAVEPLAVGGALIRRLAQVAGVRVLVGTRQSTNDSPDHPTTDRDLLDALGCRPSEDGSGPAELRVLNDATAVAEYARQRLNRAAADGRLSDTPGIRAAVEGIAGRLQNSSHTFLFARLLAHELIAEPSLLDPARADTASKLLEGDHRGLFATAVKRLSAKADSFLPLLEALAFARGRGVPIRSGIWAAMAAALACRNNNNDVYVSDDDISVFLKVAEPYVAIDADAGQTVYRLAHRTFAEHFLFGWGA